MDFQFLSNIIGHYIRVSIRVHFNIGVTVSETSEFS